MLAKNPAVLQTSTNPRELVNMARVYAASNESADQALLFSQLDSAQFLLRLNENLHYIALKPQTLLVAGIIRTLMEQEQAPARTTLINLTESPTFQSYPSLIELNIRALACDRPASPRTVAYWDKHSQPQSSTTSIVMEAIFINRSSPALDLLQRKMNDPRHGEDYKQVWLRDQVLRARNYPEVLAWCESVLIQKTLQARWHSPLLEVLFDYDEKWYISCEFPRPPERAAAKPEAKETLGRIGRHAVNHMQIYIPGLREKIKLVMIQIGQPWEKTERQGLA